MGHFFEEGGFTMIPLLLLGFLLTVVAGLEALRPAAKLRGVAVSVGAAVAAAGGLGFVLGVVTTLRASQQAEGEAIPVRLILGGVAESANNLTLALVFLVLAACLLAVGALRGRTA